MITKIELDKLVEKFCKKKITLEEMFKELKRIITYTEYKEWLVSLCLMLIPPLFVLMLGGKYLDTLTATVCGAILVLISKSGKKIKSNAFIMNSFSTIIISIVSFIGNRVIGTNIDLVIIGTIMPLVPGVAITNAAMDTLNGDYMSGIAKILEAFVKATSIAIGVGIGIEILNLILGGINL